MIRGSLRLRLLLAGAASILLALALAGAGLTLLFERHVERRVVAELQGDLRQLIDGLQRGADGALEIARPPAEPRFAEPLSGLYWQIQDQNGAILRARSLWDASLDLPADELPDGAAHEHTIPGPGGARLLALGRRVLLPASLGGGAVRVAVAMDRAEIAAAGRAFAGELVPSLALLAAVLIAAAWLQVTLGLRPLDALQRRLAAVRAGAAPRLGAAFPDEVQPLAAEIDSLLDAQDAAIERARARAADLAHGLKTPLTVLAAEAQELRDRGETRIAGEIATVAEGMRRHVERELARARAGARIHAGPPQPVLPVAERIAGVLRRTPQGSALAWQVEIPPDLATRTDAQDLAEILGSLAENAAEWAKTTVRIAAHRDGDSAVILIEDDGPGIPGPEIDTVLTRGGRLDTKRPGTGLGLPIARDLAELHGGALSLEASPLGGLRAGVRLPGPGRAAPR